MNPPIKNQIKKLRKIKGIKQQNLAKRLNIDRTYLSKLENQYYSPSPELMYKICKLFEAELGEIFFI
ncbi:helix-turn-helix transcriptional regulator [Alkaliphilus pronyensis]|uniref:Helix-turn-helix transcriptional regulator n=1 Tax=Alkaliphilus pronyensis TaxID=1482732 RepID=A0A6I0F1A4_9FIRM|nr:helix-turn-helix transcriptional regulator [Alkaliphilus pronyensis]KAB3529596.1 helix-turn-helix transcriptional regulator [Alkaliphilus pronyensis]